MKVAVAEQVAEREAEVEALESEMAQVCGLLNAGVGRLVGLIARVLETEAWAGWGIRSPEQWVAWRCGVSGGRARQLVAMARRLPELPQTRAALEAGELGEDQVAVICRQAPAHADGAVASFARHATVAQLRRVLTDYVWQPRPQPHEEEGEERRRVSFGHGDDGWWRLSACLPPDEGAVVETALAAARQSQFAQAEDAAARAELSWADALVAVADASLSPGARPRPQRDRTTVVVHLGADAEGRPSAHLHLGPALSHGLRRYVLCDATVRAILDGGGRAVSVGRASRSVPQRTRLVIEERDRGCRVPGCDRRRGLEVHHVRHWEDGGTTDTWNLVCLCGRHHRLHHLGRLQIWGNADEPDGLVFADERGRRLTGSGGPAPPGDVVIEGHWKEPFGDRLDRRWVDFGPQAATPA